MDWGRSHSGRNAPVSANRVPVRQVQVDHRPRKSLRPVDLGIEFLNTTIIGITTKGLFRIIQ